MNYLSYVALNCDNPVFFENKLLKHNYYWDGTGEAGGGGRGGGGGGGGGS